VGSPLARRSVSIGVVGNVTRFPPNEERTQQLIDKQLRMLRMLLPDFNFVKNQMKFALFLQLGVCLARRRRRRRRQRRTGFISDGGCR